MPVATGYIERRTFFAREERLSFNFSMGQLQKAPMGFASRISGKMNGWAGLSPNGASKFKAKHRTSGPKPRGVKIVPMGSMPMAKPITGDWGGTQEKMVAALSGFAPDLMRSFQTNLYPIALRAFEKWPVRTGRSKSKIFLEYKLVNDTQIVASWGCGAGYANFIKSGKIGKEEIGHRLSPASVWIRKPGNKIVKKLWQDSLKGA